MKTDRRTPLEGIASFQRVPEYHSPDSAAGSGVHPGDIVDDRFLVTEVVSRSGMTLIFRAQDLRNGSADVALKIPHPESERDAGFLSRLQQEEKIGLSLDHPFLLKFIPIATPRTRPYFVTEYVRGCTLAHLLTAMSPLPEKDALRIGALLCEALQYLHDHGVAHCDLKPHNVMVGCDGTIRLLDFGLATPIGWHRVPFRRLAPPMGTPDYMAPEQVKGKRGGPRTDIYGLGAMLYEMLTGRAPFEGDNALVVMNARVMDDPEPLREIDPAISPEAERIVLRAMSRRPAGRHSCARVLGAELARAADSQPAGYPSAANGPALNRGPSGWEFDGDGPGGFRRSA
jgi:serine/threonine-protein kinase